MSEEKDNGKKGRAGCCGTFLGCLVLGCTLLAILIGVFIIPAMRERGWTFDSARRATADLIERIEEWFDKVEDHAEDAADTLEDQLDGTKSTAKKAVKSAKSTASEVHDSAADVLPGVISD